MIWIGSCHYLILLILLISSFLQMFMSISKKTILKMSFLHVLSLKTGSLWMVTEILEYISLPLEIYESTGHTSKL